MRTRCPQCSTIFRITPEQLRFRAGKVRCGHCQAVFNALDTLIEEAPAVPPTPRPEAPPPSPEPQIPAPAAAAPAQEPAAESEPASFAPPQEPVAEAPPAEPDGTEMGDRVAPAAEPAPEAGSEPEESPEESTQAARAAGLVAARELTEVPGYNRWAASPLSGTETEPRQRITWPFTLAATLLGIVLAVQLIYHFRTEIVQRLPEAAALFTALGADVPLPHDANLVSIEASDLQADAARGLLVLQATLRNRAPYSQAWPALELTLTDAQDKVVARRVLYAPDYLPRGADPAAFAANGEIAIRLWIEAKDVAAVGYRLYVFYP